MAQKPSLLSPERSPVHRFGAQLRRLRESSGLSQAELGRLIHVSGDQIAKVEKGLRRPTHDLARRCDKVLAAEGILVELWVAASQWNPPPDEQVLPSERALFGVGAVSVAVPLRRMPGRALPMISIEDSLAAERLAMLLSGLGLSVRSARIPPSGQWQPAFDTIAICGPKSSGVTAEAIASDPLLAFEPDAAGRWAIRERDGSRRYSSAMDDHTDAWTDVAYIGRVACRRRSVLIIAGVHALGSVGAVDYLSREAGAVYSAVGVQRFSMVIQSEHDGERVVRSELLCPPRLHG